MLDTTTSYRLIARDMTRSLAQKAKEPQVALESANYMKKIGDVKSIDDFLKDTRLFKFAMTAFGLEDMAYAKGFVRKVLTEGVGDPKSLANRLTDTRFKALATAFNFQRDGAAATSSAATRQEVVDRYVRQTLETAAGGQDEGVRLALYFERTAPTVKTAYGLLGDEALWTVVKTVLGFPREMASADIAKQAAAVNKRFDFGTLSDPAKLAKFITRFTAMWDAQNVQSAPILALFGNGGARSGVGLDLAMTLHNLKRGGA